VIEASFKVLTAVPDIMNKVRLFQDRILTDGQDEISLDEIERITI